MAVLLSTSGTLGTVTISDLGGRSFVHPVTDLDISDQYTFEELRQSEDLGAALDSGYISLTNDGEIVGNSSDLKVIEPQFGENDGNIPLSDLQDISTNRILGRTGAGSGEILELTANQARNLLNVDDGANNYTHPNHTGEVTSTGDGATVVDPTAISNKPTDATLAGSEELLINDDGTLKKTTAQDIADLGVSGTFNPIITTPVINDILQYDGVNWVNKVRYNTQVVVKSLSDLPTPVGAEIQLATDTIYLIDTDLDITGYTLVFGAKTQINGIGQNVSVIRSSTSGTVGSPYVFFKSTANLFMNDLEIVCEGTNQRVWQCIGDGVTVPEGESFELNRFNLLSFPSGGSGHNNELGYIKDIRQGFIGTFSCFGFENGFTCAGAWAGGFRVDNTLFRVFSGTAFGSDTLDPVSFTARMASNANLEIPSGSIGYDFPETAFSFTGQYQLQEGNVSGAGTYVTNFASGFPAFDLLANFQDNTGIQNTFQGGEWVNTADTNTIINTLNVWEDLNVTTSNKFLTWFSESNGRFTYNGGTPIDITVSLVLSMTGKNNDIIGVRIIKEDSGGTQTVLLQRAITLQGNSTQGRAQAVPLITTDQLVLGDIVFVQVRNVLSTTNITTEIDSNCVIGAK